MQNAKCRIQHDACRAGIYPRPTDMGDMEIFRIFLKNGENIPQIPAVSGA